MIIITSILLLIIAVILFCLLTPFGVLWAIVTSIKLGKYKHFIHYISNIFFALAFLTDILGNTMLSPFMNRWFITKETPYKFGSVKHTISLVIGYNFNNNTLTNYGLKLYNILEKVDPGHCKNAIYDFENIKFKNNPWLI